MLRDRILTDPTRIRENAVAPREPETAEAPRGASGKRLMHARRPAAMPCAAPRPRGGLGLPHLGGGEGAFRQTRVAEPDLDFDDAVAPDARAHGKRQTTEDELEMRNLQPLRRQGDLAVGGEASRVEMDA